MPSYFFISVGGDTAVGGPRNLRIRSNTRRYYVSRVIFRAFNQAVPLWQSKSEVTLCKSLAPLSKSTQTVFLWWTRWESRRNILSCRPSADNPKDIGSFVGITWPWMNVNQKRCAPQSCCRNVKVGETIFEDCKSNCCPGTFEIEYLAATYLLAAGSRFKLWNYREL